MFVVQHTYRNIRWLLRLTTKQKKTRFGTTGVRKALPIKAYQLNQNKGKWVKEYYISMLSTTPSEDSLTSFRLFWKILIFNTATSQSPFSMKISEMSVDCIAANRGMILWPKRAPPTWARLQPRSKTLHFLCFFLACICSPASRLAIWERSTRLLPSIE